MPRNNTLETTDELKEAEGLVKSLIDQYGLDFVLRLCATAAIPREADYRATKEFTGQGAR